MDDEKSRIRVIQCIGYFRDLPPERLVGLARRLVQREYAAGEALTTAGTESREAFIVVEGTCESGRNTDGAWKSFGRSGPGLVFNVGALFEPMVSTSQTIAVTAVCAFTLSADAFREQLAQDGLLALAVIDRLRLELAAARRTADARGNKIVGRRDPTD